MKKRILTAVLAAVLATAISVPAMAGVWILRDTGKWQYDTLGRGTEEGLLKSQWAWLDGNHDSVSECYYFDADGNMAASTTIDGWTVNENGQWTVDGVVQTKIEGVNVSASSTAVDLIETTEPSAMNYAEKFDTAETANGLTWTNGYRLQGDLSRAPYVTFHLDKLYQVMTITFAPEAGQAGAENGRITVTGLTSGDSLYRSDKITSTGDPVNVTFNVSGETDVRINSIRGCNYLIDSIIVQ